MLSIRPLALALSLALTFACGPGSPASESSESDAQSPPDDASSDESEPSREDASTPGDASALDSGAPSERDAEREAGSSLDGARSDSASTDSATPTSDASVPKVDAEAGAAAAVLEPFGVGSHWNEVSKYAALRAAGVQVMRIDLSWNELEPTQGSFDWPKVDAALAEAEKQGIKVLAVLGYTPTWARSGDSHNFAPSESFDDEWGKYVQATVSRYDDKVAAWEVWNEPDHDNFLKLGAGTWAKNHHPTESAVNQKRLQYKHLLDIALAQPALAGNVITTSGFAEGGNWDSGLRPWLANQSGFLARFDVASFHCYGYPSYQRLIDVPASYRATQAAIGKPRWPFWITEHGINTTGVPADTVKTYLIRTYAVALAQAGVEKLFWFRAGYDPGHMDLFDAASKTTPAYDAYKTLTTHWARPLQITGWSASTARGSIATLASGKRVAIVWSEAGTPALSALGLSIESAANQDGASVGLDSPLSGAPVFLSLRD